MASAHISAAATAPESNRRRKAPDAHQTHQHLPTTAPLASLPQPPSSSPGLGDGGEPAYPEPVVDTPSVLSAWVHTAVALLLQVLYVPKLQVLWLWLLLWHSHVGLSGMFIVCLQQMVVGVVVAMGFGLAAAMSVFVSLWRCHADAWSLAKAVPIHLIVHLALLLVSSSVLQHMYAPLTLSFAFHVLMFILLLTSDHVVVRCLAFVLVPLHFMHFGLLNSFDLPSASLSEVMLLAYCVCWLRRGRVCDGQLLSFVAQVLLAYLVVLPGPVTLWAHGLLSLSALALTDLPPAMVLPPAQ